MMLWKTVDILKEGRLLHTWLGEKSFVSYRELIIPQMNLTFTRRAALTVCYNTDEKTAHVALICQNDCFKRCWCFEREDTCIHDWVGKVLLDPWTDISPSKLDIHKLNCAHSVITLVKKLNMLDWYVLLYDCLSRCGQGMTYCVLKQLNHCQAITYRAYLHMKVSLAWKYVDLDMTAGNPH